MGRNRSISDQDILVHAREVFLESGASGSTKEIARRAGVSEATLFLRFPTKVTLFLSAMIPPKADVEALFKDLENLSMRTRLELIGHRLLAHFRSLIPTVMRLTMHPNINIRDIATSFDEPPYEGYCGALAEYLKRMKEKGLAEVDDPFGAAALFVSAIHGLALFELADMHGANQLDQAVEVFVQALWRGLEPGRN